MGMGRLPEFVKKGRVGRRNLGLLLVKQTVLHPAVNSNSRLKPADFGMPKLEEMVWP